MNKSQKVSAYLRLAEMCDNDERRIYMNEVKKLLNEPDFTFSVEGVQEDIKLMRDTIGANGNIVQGVIDAFWIGHFFDWVECAYSEERWHDIKMDPEIMSDYKEYFSKKVREIFG